ncbi:ferric reductase-like transmembrane domain-containing protein [Tropicibacter sp. R16_0]|uniref:ferredoxin reductase family protein n=1 Tax=Tropicibacter sp. R16_0 TaxID=2821102 RepID=UPI001ADBF4CC|nr:ferric reductase-like transmembrane domain-containing protein [Tropicibacter sp. R16_0]MBO9450068.1 ferric reductase-like transmembrane domain-containing protein [Tropicibacter sp. R16_0]
MSRKTLMLAAGFVMAHVILVAPFVPLANILPASLGALSMSSMSLTLILAARWRIVDRVMGGPDKSYGAHRWLGFFALAGALGHWATAETFGAGVVPFLAESGESVGWLAAMGLLLLTCAAMVRAIPYHLWKASHMLMGPVFLLAAFHTFIVASPLAVGVAPWTLMAVASVVGLLAWGQTLLRKLEPTKLVAVESAVPFDGGVDVTFCADNPMPSFRPGQFATIAHNTARAEAHPFTIAGGSETTRRFVIRSAGDWTDEFVNTVAVGDTFRLGRGVGRFLPQVHAKRTEQLWVAGGVGITPFMAALERMEPDSNARVTLIYCIRSRSSAGAMADVEHHAARLPQVDLYVLSDTDGDRLTPARLTQIMREMSTEAQVYLCGPEGLKVMVTTAWETLGKTGRVHSERFDFRGAYGLTDLIYIGRPALVAARDWMAKQREVPNAASGT